MAEIANDLLDQRYPFLMEKPTLSPFNLVEAAGINLALSSTG